MITKASSEALRDIAPPTLIVGASLMGISLQDWVWYFALAYSAVRLLMLFPKVIGCGSCFYRNRTCTLECKKPLV